MARPKLFGSARAAGPGQADDAGVLRWCRDVVSRVNTLGPEMEARTEEGLRALTGSFRGRLSRGERLDDLLPEAFAVVREAAARTLGQRHFDVQVMGGAVLHLGKIAEMRTGEGKTLTATLPRTRLWRPGSGRASTTRSMITGGRYPSPRTARRRWRIISASRICTTRRTRN